MTPFARSSCLARRFSAWRCRLRSNNTSFEPAASPASLRQTAPSQFGNPGGWRPRGRVAADRTEPLFAIVPPNDVGASQRRRASADICDTRLSTRRRWPRPPRPGRFVGKLSWVVAVKSGDDAPRYSRTELQRSSCGNSLFSTLARSSSWFFLHKVRAARQQLSATCAAYGLWPVSSVSVGLLCGLTCLLFAVCHLRSFFRTGDGVNRSRRKLTSTSSALIPGSHHCCAGPCDRAARVTRVAAGLPAKMTTQGTVDAAARPPTQVQDTT